MNFKTLMPVREQQKMMEDVEQHTFAPDLIISPVMLQPNHFKNFQEASQNITITKRTVGEPSADELHYLGIKYAFVGHLERRIQLHEGYDIIHNKLENALRHKIIPIICMGSQNDEDGIEEEFNKIVGDLDLSNHEVIISWESIKSTLEGKRLYTDETAERTFKELKKILSKYDNVKYRLVLGGHVEPREAELAKKLGIDGVLIGDRFKTFDQLDTILKPLS
ncbi:triose-phosphate isomerase [Lactobacillus sp. Sy-1]|uniref:triose-phosphate isomerase n=1 Tax=Lactobacillus sp. Sy-1 TaxID=2109645 RepID=UPI001C5932D4|nr:triose-phosphate isomerase [Lactobacillus sp. Sy-1]MBW1605004.1 triose-phosphate isomerase [Lactobacillus sp. Sy-1]